MNATADLTKGTLHGAMQRKASQGHLRSKSAEQLIHT